MSFFNKLFRRRAANEVGDSREKKDTDSSEGSYSFCATPLVNSVMDCFEDGRRMRVADVEKEMNVTTEQAQGYLESLAGTGILRKYTSPEGDTYYTEVRRGIK